MAKEYDDEGTTKILGQAPASCLPPQVEIRKMIALERIADRLEKIGDRIDALEEAVQRLSGKDFLGARIPGK